MRYKLRITRLLILFYLLGSFASAAHFHNDATEVHSDCKICHLSNAMHGGDVVAKPLLTMVLPSYVLPLNPLHLGYYNNLISKGFYSQAPPLFLIF